MKTLENRDPMSEDVLGFRCFDFVSLSSNTAVMFVGQSIFHG